MSNKEIARDLDLAVGTVKVHVAGLYRTLGVKNRTAAAAVGTGVTEQGQGLAAPFSQFAKAYAVRYQLDLAVGIFATDNHMGGACVTLGACSQRYVGQFLFAFTPTGAERALMSAPPN
jgi:Bacterial regulatory proteins, luxR family